MAIKGPNCANIARAAVKIPHTITLRRLAEMARTMTVGEFVLTAFDAVTTATQQTNKETRQQAIDLVALYRPDALTTAQNCWAPWVRVVQAGRTTDVRLRGLSYLLSNVLFQAGTGKRIKRVDLEVSNA